jgi:hypothetical protein
MRMVRRPCLAAQDFHPSKWITRPWMGLDGPWADKVGPRMGDYGPQRIEVDEIAHLALCPIFCGPNDCVSSGDKLGIHTI